MSKGKERQPICEAMDKPCSLAEPFRLFPCLTLEQWRKKRLGEKETQEERYRVIEKPSSGCRLIKRTPKKDQRENKKDPQI